jgi:tyrosyl-tRNA synthetase
MRLKCTLNCSYLFKIGGNDQMGNIMSGQELISRLENTRVYGILYFHG